MKTLDILFQPLKTIIGRCTIACVLVIGAMPLHAEILNCSELSSAIDLLDDINNELDTVESVSDQGDDFLADLTNALYSLADEENDSTLQRLTDDLADDWVAGDLDAFQASLDGIADRMHSLYKDDC